MSGDKNNSFEEEEITPELRTQWNNILKISKIHKAHQARLSQLAIITVLFKRLGKLPKTEIQISHSRRFHVIKTEADETFERANHLNKAFIATLTDQDEYIISNPIFTADQDNFQEVLDSFYDDLMDYKDLLIM